MLESVRSVANQTWQDFELIVVDDASTTPVDAEELRTILPSVRLLRMQSSIGGAGAKHAGALAARGEILAFLDDDDLWSPEYLASAIRILEAARDVRVLFMGVRWFGERAEAGQAAQERGMAAIRAQTAARPDPDGVLRFGEDLFTALLERVPMPFQRPVTYRDDYLEIGGYRSECLLWDCDWALRAALRNHCALLQGDFYLQRASGQGYSSQGRRALEHAQSNLEMKTALLDHPLLSPQRHRALCKALHRDWKSYAWQLNALARGGEALRALMSATRYGLSMEVPRMFARICLRAVVSGFSSVK